MERPEIEDNQRLEFLGDAVFGLLSAAAVFAAYPGEQEGSLTVRRTHLVSTSAQWGCGAVAEERQDARRRRRGGDGCDMA